MLDNSLQMNKIDRNMSEFCLVACKNIILTSLVCWVCYMNYLSTHRHDHQYTETRTNNIPELSKKMDGIWNLYNFKSTGRIYTFCVLKCSEKFKVLDLP